MSDERSAQSHAHGPSPREGHAAGPGGHEPAERHASSSARTLVLYHDRCVDGLVAAWAVHRALGGEVECLPVRYQQPPPEVTGRDVVIVDFSYPLDVLLAMKAAARSLRVYDHHKTAMLDLEGLAFCTFDAERSGAGLAWDSFHAAPRPWIVSYAEDRDLWRWALPLSREINAWLQSALRTLEDIEAALRAGPVAAVESGKAVLVAQRAYIDATKATVRRCTLLGLGPVPVVNAGAYCGSEMLGELAQGEPFAMRWQQEASGLFRYSLRSRNQGLDVSAIAERFGGGGNHNAAGFDSRTLVHVPCDAQDDAGGTLEGRTEAQERRILEVMAPSEARTEAQERRILEVMAQMLGVEFTANPPPLTLARRVACAAMSRGVDLSIFRNQATKYLL